MKTKAIRSVAAEMRLDLSAYRIRGGNSDPRPLTMLAVLDARQLHFAAGALNGEIMIIIDKMELIVDLDNLTQLQAQLMRDITGAAYAAAGTDPTPAQLLDASETCAEQSYDVRTPTGPSGELAAVYRAIGRALAERDGTAQPAAPSSLIVGSRVVSADPENTGAGTIERLTLGKEATVRWDDGSTSVVVVEDLRPEPNGPPQWSRTATMGLGPILLDASYDGSWAIWSMSQSRYPMLAGRTGDTLASAKEGVAAAAMQLLQRMLDRLSAAEGK